MTDRAGRLFVASLVVVAIGFATFPGRGEAQSSFGFSFGSGGGHHHGHHHHCHGPRGWSFGYGFGPVWAPAYYAPPPAIVYAAPPAPVVKERVIYVPQAPAPVPAVPYSSTTAPSGSLASSSAPSIAGGTANDDRIVIRNSANAQLAVTFLVDGQDVELVDGATKTFVGKTQRTIQYDRGGRFGSTQQDLTGGQYEFRITASGWDLVRRPDLAPSSRTAIRSNSLPEAAVR